MRARWLLVVLLLAGCGDDGMSAEPLASPTATPAPEAETPAARAAAAPVQVQQPAGPVPTIDVLPAPETYPDTPKGLTNGAWAPELALPDLARGGDYRLSQYVGPKATEDGTHVAIVGMVASWCGPCTASLPFLKTLKEQHGDALEVVLIATDVDAEGRAKEAAKVRASGLDAAVLDPTDADLRAWMGGRRNVPHFYIVNKVGEVLVQDRGFGNKVRKVMPKQIDYALRHPDYVQRRKPQPRTPAPTRI